MAQFQSSGVTGSLDVTTNITASGHISASIFYGDGSGLSGVSAGGISSLVEDQSPQLGGTLDVNGQGISGSTIEVTGSTHFNIPDNNSNAFSIVGNGHEYINIDTTDGDRKIKLISNSGSSTPYLMIDDNYLQLFHSGYNYIYLYNNIMRIQADAINNNLYFAANAYWQINGHKDATKKITTIDKEANFYHRLTPASSSIFSIEQWGSPHAKVGSYIAVSSSSDTIQFSGSSIQMTGSASVYLLDPGSSFEVKNDSKTYLSIVSSSQAYSVDGYQHTAKFGDNNNYFELGNGNLRANARQGGATAIFGASYFYPFSSYPHSTDKSFNDFDPYVPYVFSMTTAATASVTVTSGFAARGEYQTGKSRRMGYPVLYVFKNLNTTYDYILDFNNGSATMQIKYSDTDAYDFCGGGNGLTLSPGETYIIRFQLVQDNFMIAETVERTGKDYVSLTGSSIQMTGSLNVSAPDNTSGALLIQEGSNEYIRINTSNSSEETRIKAGGTQGLIIYGNSRTTLTTGTTASDSDFRIINSGGTQIFRVQGNHDTRFRAQNFIISDKATDTPYLTTDTNTNFTYKLSSGAVFKVTNSSDGDLFNISEAGSINLSGSSIQVTGSLSITGSSGGTIQSSLDSSGTGSLRLFTDGTQINPFISLTAWSGSFPFKFAYISTGTETGASEPSASLSLSHYPPLAGGVATLTSSLHTDIKGKHVRLNTDQTDNTYTVTSDDLYVDGNFKASGGSHVEMRTTTEVFSASATQIDIGITDAAGTTDVYIGRSTSANPVIKIDASTNETIIETGTNKLQINQTGFSQFANGNNTFTREYLQGSSTYWTVTDGTNDYLRVNKSANSGAGNCDSIIMSGSLVAITSSQTKLVDDDGNIYFRTNKVETGLGGAKYTQVGGNVSIVGLMASNYIRTYGTTLIVDGATLDNSLNASSEYFRSAANDTTIYLGYSGPFRVTGSMVITGSGSTLLKVEGSQGDLFSVTDSLSGSLFSVNDISGLPVLEAFSDNTIVMGDFAAPSLTTTARATINSPGGYVFSIPTGTYDGYYIDYTVVSSSLGDMRAGQIITIRSGSSYHYTEQTTTDFGSTTAVTFNVEASGSNVSLYATASSGTYTVKAIVRAI